MDYPFDVPHQSKILEAQRSVSVLAKLTKFEKITVFDQFSGMLCIHRGAGPTDKFELAKVMYANQILIISMTFLVCIRCN